MKKYLLLFVLAVAALTVTAKDKGTDLAKLYKRRQANLARICSLRQKLIAGDKELRALHERIMVLHRELAVKLNENPVMRKLLAEQRSLEKQIAQLQQRKNSPTNGKTGSGNLKSPKTEAKRP